MKLTLLYVAVLFSLTNNSSASKSDIQFYDKEIETTQAIVWSIVERVCFRGIGAKSETSKSLACTSSGCDAEVRFREFLYKQEVIFDSDFNMFFSEEHDFDGEAIEEKILKSDVNNLDVKLVINTLGLDSHLVKGISECSKRHGEAIKSEFNNTPRADSLYKSIGFDELNSAYKAITLKLNDLDYSKVTVVHPYSVLENDGIFIQVVVVPSLRFKIKFDNEDLYNGNSSEDLARKELRNFFEEFPLLKKEDIDGLPKSITENFSDEKYMESLSESYMTFPIEEDPGPVVQKNINKIKSIDTTLAREISLDSSSMIKYISTTTKYRDSVLLNVNRYSKLSVSIKGEYGMFESVSPTELPLSGLTPSKWLFEQKQKSRGSQIVYLELKGVDLFNGEEFYYKYPIEIDVKTSFVQKILKLLSGSWQWILGTVFIPLIVFLWKRKFRLFDLASND